jgi:hypothetical protein
VKLFHRLRRVRHRFYLATRVVGSEIYRLNRQSAFARRLIEARNRLLADKTAKTLAVVAMALLICYRLGSFCRGFLNSSLALVQSGERQNPFRLIGVISNLDILLLLVVAAFLIILVCLFSGSPRKGTKLPLLPALRGRPIVLAILVGAVLFWGLIEIPGRFANWMEMSDGKGPRSSPTSSYDLLWNFFVFPPRTYWLTALVVSLGVAISLADLAVDESEPPVRWWSIPFLLVPSPYPYQFPLLWWNAARGWLPSRVWFFFRPWLTIAMVLPLFSAYVDAQPIRQEFPQFEGARSPRTVPITSLPGEPLREGYQVEPFAGEQGKFFLRSADSICLFVRANGGWVLTDKTDVGFQWDEGVFDFQKKRAYLFDSIAGQLNIFEFDSSHSRLVEKVRLSLRSKYAASVRMAYDSRRGILYILTREREMIGYDLERRATVRRFFFEIESGLLVDILFDEALDQLLVLQIKQLSVFAGENGKLRKTIPMPYQALGLYLDRTAGRLLISFPSRLAVGTLPIGGDKILSYLDAPAGVRTIQVDLKRGLVFMGSFSGVMEIRSRTDNRLLGRTRFSPWIHWIGVMPDYGDIIVTHGEARPLAYHYDPPIIDHDLVGHLEWWIENLLRHPRLRSLLKLD